MKNKDQYEDALDKVARYVSDSKVGIYIFKITNELDNMFADSLATLKKLVVK